MNLARIVVLKADGTMQFHRWVTLNKENAAKMVHRVNLLNRLPGVSKAWIRIRDIAHAFR